MPSTLLPKFLRLIGLTPHYFCHHNWTYSAFANLATTRTCHRCGLTQRPTDDPAFLHCVLEQIKKDKKRASKKKPYLNPNLPLEIQMRPNSKQLDELKQLQDWYESIMNGDTSPPLTAHQLRIKFAFICTVGSDPEIKDWAGSRANSLSHLSPPPKRNIS